MFDHDGEKWIKISENLTTWYMDTPKERILTSQVLHEFFSNFVLLYQTVFKHVQKLSKWTNSVM